MAVLERTEIEAGIRAGQFITNPRVVDEQFVDLQAASYDLTAGVAVWRDNGEGRVDGVTHEVRFRNPADRMDHQQTVELQPGQMMSIITREELVVPPDVCATVYSKNTVALKGIFAFNAGHVDPGYRGPIILRVLNLRRTKFTLTMGQPVFLVVFERLKAASSFPSIPACTHENALLAVRDFSNYALGNALFELYAGEIEKRLDRHRSSVLETVRRDFEGKFVERERVGHIIWVRIGIAVAALVAMLAGIVNIVSLWPDCVRVLRGE